jgi:hypothetical protein
MTNMIAARRAAAPEAMEQAVKLTQAAVAAYRSLAQGDQHLDMYYRSFTGAATQYASALGSDLGDERLAGLAAGANQPALPYAGSSPFKGA